MDIAHSGSKVINDARDADRRTKEAKESPWAAEVGRVRGLNEGWWRTLEPNRRAVDGRRAVMREVGRVFWQTVETHSRIGKGAGRVMLEDRDGDRTAEVGQGR